MDRIPSLTEAGARVRLSPSFELASFSASAAQEVLRLQEYASDPAWAGVLIPRGGDWRRVHLVTHESSAALARLRDWSAIPPTVERNAVARWILDGVLELEHEEGVLSGPAAYPLFFPGTVSEPSGCLGRLSIEAIRLAIASGQTDPKRLAERLYRHNTCPDSPAWRRRFPDRTAVERVLELDDSEGSVGGTAAWPPSLIIHQERAVWRTWELPDAPVPGPDEPSFKLYVSPRLQELPRALGAVLSLLSRPEAPFAAKVGRDLAGLLRPDKLVAYFVNRDRLLEAAEWLRPVLAGMPTQGVPFTRAVTPDGILSEGLDPGDRTEPPGPRRHGSWRGWVTARLGGAISAAVGSGADIPVLAYVLDRVGLEGVDVSDWAAPSWFTGLPDAHADH